MLALESEEMTALTFTFYETFSISGEQNKFCKRSFLIPGLAKNGTKLLHCDQIRAQLSLFIKHPWVVHQAEQLLLKNFFDLMLSLESDKVTALWPNDSLNFDFHKIFQIV